jgi:hypothetical protein
MIHVQCKGCGKWKIIAGGDVHDAVDSTGCQCCPIDHHHGQAVAMGAAPCRPITITLMAPTDEFAGTVGGVN